MVTKRPGMAIGAVIVGGVLAATSAVGVTFAQTGGTATATPSAQATAQADKTAEKTARMNEYLAKLAGNLGISVDQLKAGAATTASQIIDENVAAGRLTAEQGAAAKARIASGEGAFFFGGHAGPGGRGEHGPGRDGGQRGPAGVRGGNVLEAAATAIGIDQQALMTELQSGRTLAQVAEAHGKTRDRLKAALTAQFGQSLDRVLDSTFPARPARPAASPTGSAS